MSGRFKVAVMLQKRVRELVRGANPLVSVTPEMSPIDIAEKEILEQKIKLVDRMAPGKLTSKEAEQSKKEVTRETKKHKGK